jgi:hypothetical protein
MTDRTETGFRQRRQDEARETVRRVIAPVLADGEELGSYVLGQARPRGAFGLDVLIGVFAMLTSRNYWIALTDRRFFLLACGRPLGAKPVRIEWEEPIEGVTVDRYREGPAWTLLAIRPRVTDERAVRLRISRVMRAEARAIAERLGAPAPG